MAATFIIFKVISVNSQVTSKNTDTVQIVEEPIDPLKKYYEQIENYHGTTDLLPAISALKRETEINPKNIKAWTTAAKGIMWQGYLHDDVYNEEISKIAADLLEEGLLANPESLEIKSYLVKTLLKSNQKVKGRQVATEINKTSPNSEYDLWAKAYIAQDNNYTEELINAGKLLYNFGTPETKEYGRFMIVEGYYRYGKCDEIGPLEKEAFAIRDNTWTRINLAKWYANCEKDYDKIIELLEESYNKERIGVAGAYLSYAYWKKAGTMDANDPSQRDQADKLYRKAIEANPQNYDALYYYSLLLINQFSDQKERLLEARMYLDKLNSMPDVRLNFSLKLAYNELEKAEKKLGIVN